MLTSKDIERRIRDRQLELIRISLRKKLRRSPDNCSHNHTHQIPNTEDTIRLCMYGSEDIENWPGDICDRDETAQACKVFSCKYEKQEVIEDENAKLSDNAYIKNAHPDIAALLWVLTSDSKWKDLDGEPDPHPYAEDLSWWQKVKLKLGI